MHSRPKPVRADSAPSSSQSSTFADRQSPQGSHRHVSRHTHPQPVKVAEFASCHCARIHFACASPSLAASPSPAHTPHGARRFTYECHRANLTCSLETRIYQTNPVPFSNTPAPSTPPTAKSKSSAAHLPPTFNFRHPQPLWNTKLPTRNIPVFGHPGPLCRVRSQRASRPRAKAELALPAKLMLIHSHGGTA